MKSDQCFNVILSKKMLILSFGRILGNPRMNLCFVKRHSFHWIEFKESLDEVSGFRHNMIRKHILDLADVSVCHTCIIAFKGRSAHKKLVSQDPQTPMIDFLVVLLVSDHLRRQVINGSTHGFPARGGSMN